MQVHHHEVNHTTGEANDTSRNILVESARIARGKVASLQVKITRKKQRIAHVKVPALQAKMNCTSLGYR
jgi:enhancing lycopene biosynthesis protein 2